MLHFRLLAPTITSSCSPPPLLTLSLRWQNREFGMPAIANASVWRQKANNYPQLRFFSVGHSTQSKTPLKDLKTVWEPWLVSSNSTVWRDFGLGHMTFSTVSAVCYLFGAALSDKLGPDIPLGLISDNVSLHVFFR